MGRHFRIPGLIDITTVDEPGAIASNDADPRLDRAYEKTGPLFNRLLAGRLMRVFEIKGVHFPTMRSRDDAERRASQAALSQRLCAAAKPTPELLAAIEPLVSYVKGDAPQEVVGPTLQSVIGRLFNPDFSTSPRLWQAARRFNGAATSRNPLHWVWAALTGTLDADRKVLAEAVDNDPTAVHGVAIALHNIVKSLALMQAAYADPIRRTSLEGGAAALSCIVAPDSVLRQAKAVAEIPGASLQPGSLVVYQLGAATDRSLDAAVAFQSKSWSFCPAAGYVFWLLSLIWTQANGQAPLAPRPEFCPASAAAQPTSQMGSSVS